MPGGADCSAVDRRMLCACSASAGADSRLLRAMEHHFFAGGSRVRATFSLAASRALNVEEADALTLAAICELLHNASLIHDDLLDRAPKRRGSASVWSEFGDSTAICAGDLLLATAFSLVGEIKRVEYLPEVLSLVHRRTREVILGQDTEQTSTPQDLEEYERVAIGKSASLLSLPFELSLLLSGNQQSLAAAQRACEAFAVAYQMLDDLNDYAEDRRNGALNAVCVAMAATNLENASAIDFVRRRAETLIERSMELASALPMQSGASMVAFAETMRQALGAFRGAVTKIELLRHGG